MYPKQQRRPLPSLLYKSNRGSRKLLINSDTVHQTPDHLCLLSGYSRWRPSPRGRFWHLRHPRESAARPSRPWHQKPDSSQQYSRYSFGGIFLIWIGGFLPFFPCNDWRIYFHFFFTMVGGFVAIFCSPMIGGVLLFFRYDDQRIFVPYSVYRDWLILFDFFSTLIYGCLPFLLYYYLQIFFSILSFSWLAKIFDIFSPPWLATVCLFLNYDWRFFAIFSPSCL